eukprot:gene1739-3358_t
MQSVSVDSNADKYIRSLLTCNQPSYGMLIGHRFRDSIFVAHALQFKGGSLTNLPIFISEVYDNFLSGFGIVGIFAVSPEDPKDVARKLSAVVTNTVLPRPTLMVHFHTTSSKFTAREIYIENEEKIRPIDWKEVREILTPFLILSSSLSCDFPLSISPNPRASSPSIVLSDCSLPDYIVLGSVAFGPSPPNLQLGAYLNQAAESRGLSIGANDNADEVLQEVSTMTQTSTDELVCLPVGLAFDSQTSANPAAKDVPVTNYRLSGRLSVLAACYPTDTVSDVLAAVRYGVLSSVRLVLGKNTKVNETSSTSSSSSTTMSSEVGLVFASSHGGGSPVPLMVPGPKHSQHSTRINRLNEILTLSPDQGQGLSYNAVPVGAVGCDGEVEVVLATNTSTELTLTGKPFVTATGTTTGITSQQSYTKDEGKVMNSSSSNVNVIDQVPSTGSAVTTVSPEESGERGEEDVEEYDDDEEEVENEDGEETEGTGAAGRKTVAVTQDTSRGKKKNQVMLVVLIALGVVLVGIAIGIKILLP